MSEPLVSVWECQNWPEKVSKDHREKQNASVFPTKNSQIQSNIGPRESFL